ncbi:MAG: trypsin-like peptidase domain-containing protein [Lachnospiraceae bacterium]|nr:trypsin-like peptidase domain-containing protein [Lachnospiraceae bacterium]
MYENENYVDHTQNYATYQTTYNQQAPVPPKAPKKKKKKGVVGKVALFAAGALLLGAVAGVGFNGSQYVWDRFHPGEGVSEQVQEQQQPQQNKAPELTVSQGSDIKVTTTGNTGVVSDNADVIADMVEEVMPAMVSIINNYTTTGTTFFGQTYSKESASSGSGIIVAQSEAELLIVSNNHVVENATKLEVSFIDGSTAVAQIKGLDAKMDLAVISIPLADLSQETMDAIAIATIGKSEGLRLGESVVAIGNALGYGQSVTRGIVSALDREITSEDGITGTFIQTDAAINPGNSGGALLNMKGEVIGINSNKIGGSIIEGMGYAIPISAASPIISELMLRETRNQVAEGDMGYLGIHYYQTVPEDYNIVYNMPLGVYINEVGEGTPAHQAGLLMGDIIVSFDGRSISDANELLNAMSYYAAGETVEIEVMRLQKGKYESVIKEVTLGKRP